MTQRNYNKFGGYFDKFNGIYKEDESQQYQQPINVGENQITFQIEFKFDRDIYISNYRPNFVKQCQRLGSSIALMFTAASIVRLMMRQKYWNSQAMIIEEYE